MFRAKKDEPKEIKGKNKHIPHGLGRLICSGISGAYILEGYFEMG